MGVAPTLIFLTLKLAFWSPTTKVVTFSKVTDAYGPSHKPTEFRYTKSCLSIESKGNQAWAKV